MSHSMTEVHKLNGYSITLERDPSGKVNRATLSKMEVGRVAKMVVKSYSLPSDIERVMLIVHGQET